MKSLQRLIVVVGGIGVAMLLLASVQSRAGEDCQQLVGNKCASCHFVTYICPRIEKGKGTLYWKGILHDMIKEGLVATDEEKDRLVSCLADPDAKIKALCPAKK